MLIDFREKAEQPNSVFSAVKAGQREKGRPMEAQGLWVIYERDEADQIEAIKGSHISVTQANEGENREVS